MSFSIHSCCESLTLESDRDIVELSLEWDASTDENCHTDNPDERKRTIRLHGEEVHALIKALSRM